MDDIVSLLLLQVVLIALNAVFAGAEIAVLSCNETKLKAKADSGNKKAARLLKMKENPERFLATIQIAITLSGFLGSAFAADNFSEPLVDWVLSLGVEASRATLDTIAVILITLVLSYFTLIFGELVPKRIAMKKSEALALGIGDVLRGISTVFRPIVWLLSISTNAVLKLCGIDPHEAEETVSEEDICMMAEAGSASGAINSQENEFIRNVFAFNDTEVGDIATHRTDVTLLWLEDSDEVWADTIRQSRHTRYPVCDESPDHVVGVLNAKEYYRLDDRSRDSVMEKAVFGAYFVPETAKADEVFSQLRKTSHSLAVVIDEYGGMAGIITRNDLLEELVGDMEEDMPPDSIIEQVDADTWHICGNAELEEITTATGITFAEEDYDTLTGLVFDTLGVIPPDGNAPIEVDLPQAHIAIRRIEAHQIEDALLTKKPEIKETADEE